MDIRVKEALVEYSNGYNCSQAVSAPFAEDLGFTKEQVFKMMEGFGGGVAGKQEVCGAFSAVAFYLGMKNSDGLLHGESKTKKSTYMIIQEAAKEFEAEFGSIRCIDILHGNKPVHGTCGAKLKKAAEIILEFEEKYYK